MLAEHRQSVITEFRHSVCKDRRRQHTAEVLVAEIGLARLIHGIQA
jgi:hypothetical protein